MGSANKREFLVGVGVATIAAGLNARDGTAQSNSALKVVDFHNHFIGSGFTSVAGGGSPSQAQRAYWEQVNRNLADVSALLASIETAGISARVINTPLEFLEDARGGASPDLLKRINDHLAELVSKHPGRLYGLATVDAYSGEEGARELTRAVRELGLRGVFVESAKGEMLLDAPQARPTLAAAATLGVPVFVHPITDVSLRSRFARLGTTFNRGTINAAALVALIQSRTFDELPDLRIVVTTLAVGGLLLAGGFGDGRGLRRDALDLCRKHVYLDTMGINPVLIRSAVDMLGADHVIAGTDWPIFTEASVSQRLRTALTSCGLNETEQQNIAGGTALKLLKVA